MKAKLKCALSSPRRKLHVAAALVIASLSAQASGQSSNYEMVISSERELISQLRTLPEAELKNAYSNCSQESMRRALSGGEAALCSIVYETLLSTVFEGDFGALLAWSRIQAGHTVGKEADDAAVPSISSSRHRF